MESESSKSSNKKDPGWKYNHAKDPKKNYCVTCNFCGFTSSGGIHRAKQHQMGGFSNVKQCVKVPLEVKEELWVIFRERQELNVRSSQYEPDFFDVGDDIDDAEVEEIQNSRNKRALVAMPTFSKSKRTKGPMDLYLQKPEEVVEIRKKQGKGKLIQSSIKDSCDPKARDRTIQYIARFFYQAGIPFNATRLDSFKVMVEAIGQYGLGLKPPSYHEIRVPLLKKELQLTKNLMKNHQEKWAKTGCSIMSDAWSDRRHRSIINFLVNCTAGTMFMESVDVSSYTKTGDKLYELLDAFVEKIGEENVVQVITDNGSNYVLAGKLLQAKRKHLYWTPCAAHCVDLILEDIGKLPNVKRTIERAIFLVGFIYNHGAALSIMRTFTLKRELVRYGITRFATTFLTLERLHKQKANLRRMFTSEEWIKTDLSKGTKGKRAFEIVLMPSFWNEVVFALKVMNPLVGVLRLADNEKKPAMGYIYEAMDRAKETIAKSFGGKEERYSRVFSIIDNRWENQLHHPLHAAGHYLNPEFYYNNEGKIESNKEIIKGLYDCIERLIPSIEDQDKIFSQLHKYKEAEGMFGCPPAIRNRKKIAPAEWWSLYGSETLELKQLAIKILSLTCSAAGCERNWSVFEQLHSKKRNRLEHKKLQDLVFVKYNQQLKARYDSKDVIDPIALNCIDECNEWLIGEMGGGDAENDLVFDEMEEFTWGDVAVASGVGEPRIYTRRNTVEKIGRKEASSSKAVAATRSRHDLEEEEEMAEAEDTEEEEIEGYNFSDGNESSDDAQIDADDDNVINSD